MGTIDEFIAGQRAAWSAGEFDWIARMSWAVGGLLVERLAVGPSDAVVDVGCGTGNCAIQAAATGAHVTGVDLSPQMLAQAASAARAAHLDIAWREGNAEAIPLADGCADVVMSSFASMFAPRHDVTAREMMRILRPGGRLGVAAWTPASSVAAFFDVVGAHMPPPPPFAASPLLWGDPDHVCEIFDGICTELSFSHERVDQHFASAQEAADAYLTRFGPLIAARRILEPEGRWQPLADDIAGFFARSATDDGVTMGGEYLVTMGRRPA